MATRVISLDLEPGDIPLPSRSTVLDHSGTGLSDIVQAIVAAKRIVVVCGAGISVAAGIPDFRSPEGLFQTLKKENPKESLSSGKDLFSASVFSSEQTTSLFYKMIAGLASTSSTATPTSFHNLLRVLDERGQLLRVYTQNIDMLEEKAGISFGVPVWDASEKVDGRGAGGKKQKVVQPLSPSTTTSPSPSPATREHSPSRPAPRSTPRCIPLHGTLQTLRCSHCSCTELLLKHLSSLHSGALIPCASCLDTNKARRAVDKRERGVGFMRPSVVLYGEDSKDAEGVGECVRRDLVGLGTMSSDVFITNSPVKGKNRDPGTPRSKRPTTRPDLVIVAGTSLKVPGTNRIVREFAKAVRPPPSSPDKASSRRSTTSTRPRTIYLNLDFPVPARAWEGVFDMWVQGDVQKVSNTVRQAIRDEEKKEREKASRALKVTKRKTPPESNPSTPVKKKAKTTSSSGSRPAKSTSVLLTPPSTPRNKYFSPQKVISSKVILSKIHARTSRARRERVQRSILPPLILRKSATATKKTTNASIPDSPTPNSSKPIAFPQPNSKVEVVINSRPRTPAPVSTIDPTTDMVRAVALGLRTR